VLQREMTVENFVVQNMYLGCGFKMQSSKSTNLFFSHSEAAFQRAHLSVTLGGVMDFLNANTDCYAECSFETELTLDQFNLCR